MADYLQGYNWGAALGNGTGQCLIKTANPNGFTSLDNMLSTRVAGIKRAYLSTTYVTPSTTSTSSVSSTSAVSSSTVVSSSVSSTSAISSSTVVSSSQSASSFVTSASSAPASSSLTSSSAAVTSSASTQSTTSTSTKTSTSSVNVNSACASQPVYYANQPSLSTTNDFLSYAGFYNTAISAIAPTNYTAIFIGYYAAVSQSGYLGYQFLATYDVNACAAFCNSVSSCAGFNIYHERDPSLNPVAGASSSSCPNPPPITSVVCAIYSTAPSADKATNIGEWRASFAVAISGSNAYAKTPNTAITSASSISTTYPFVQNFGIPATLNGAIVIDPKFPEYYVDSSFYYGVWNPKQCGTFCAATTAANKAKAVEQGKSIYSRKLASFIHDLT